MVYAFFALVICFSIGMLVFYLRADNKRLGKSEEAVATARRTFDEIYKVNDARNALAASNAMRDELRSKYTRK